MFPTKKMIVGLLGSGLLMAMFAVTANANHACCQPCPPPPQKVCLTVVDPCTCCKYSVEACVPACCAGETPCLVTWRHGIFGRKVLTYKFSCGHCVEVVITAFGQAVVR